VLVPVVLSCSEEEHQKRVVAPERGALGRSKLTDAGLVAEMRGRSAIHCFGVPEELTIDITELAPEDTAEKIRQHLQNLGIL